MQYYTLDPADGHSIIWMLGYDHPARGHVVVEQYADLVCTNCGKVDEDRAVQRGIDPRVRVASATDARRDILGTHDGFILISERFRVALDAANLTGLHCVPLPGDARFHLAQPIRVRTDPVRAGLTVHGPFGRGAYLADAPRCETVNHQCTLCGRTFETCMQPTIESMETPRDHLSLFSPRLHLEKQHGAMTLLYCSEEVRRRLRSFRLRGLEFARAY